MRHAGNKILYQHLAIDYSQRWIDRHWRALCTAYSKAPYFEYFAAPLRAVLLARPTYLFELNLALLKTCLQLLQVEKHLEVSAHYEETPGEHLVDARGAIQPHQRLEESPYYQTVPYQQVFGSDFRPNLSIIDLLFCAGPQAHSILQQSLAKRTC